MATASGKVEPDPPDPPDGDHHMRWNEALKNALEDVKAKQKKGEWPKKDVPARVIRHVMVTGNPGDIKTYTIILDTDQ